MRKYLITGLLITGMFVGLPLLADNQALNQIGDSATHASFEPTWDSLSQYSCPEWFRDAKLGIFVCWNLHSLQGVDDWYCFNMYRQGHPVYKHHVATYGHPSKFGFKDFIPMWKGENFDADDLVRQFKNAGAKYIVPIATYHDNFDCWNSKHHKWNSLNMGPKKDIIGLWAEATRQQGLRFGVTTHLARSLCWMQGSHGSDKEGLLKGVPYDGADPKYQEFYHPPFPPAQRHYPPDPPQAWKDQWTNRIKDLCQQHRPDLLYFDGGLPFPKDDGLVGRKVVAWYYNQNKQWHDGRLEAVMNVKKWPVAKNHGPFSADMCVRDMEKGLLGGIEEYPWQNDTTISSWFYQPTKPVRSVNSVVDMLIDIVAKNGNLLLNVPPRPDGTLDEAHKKHLVELGQWMKVNGEAIYATRPWKQYGEGPTTVTEGHFGDNKLGLTAKDLRFTRSKDGWIVYAILMDWPGGGAMVDIKAFAGTDATEIRQVTLLGHDGPLKWTRNKEGLHVSMPRNKPCEHAFSIRIVTETSLN